MTTLRFLPAVLLAAPLMGCDAEAPTSAADYHAVGHVDIATLRATPWLKDHLDKGPLADPSLGACGDLLEHATALTFGGREGAFEVYFQGSFDSTTADACSDLIDAKVAEHGGPKDGHPRPESTLLSDDVFVVFGGDVTPSHAGLESLLGADPSPTPMPLWLTAHSRNPEEPVERVKAWASLRDGLDANVAVTFVDAAKASELYGQAMLGLTALRMSGEGGELLSAVDLGAKGDTMTLELRATPGQLKAAMKDHQAKASMRYKAHHGTEPHGEAGLQIRIGD